MSKLVLGKGLGALLPTEDENVASGQHYRMVQINEIAPNPMQPRHEFNAESLSELSESLKQNGMMQPLVVHQQHGHYVIVAGERRYRAAKMAGIGEVPVLVIDTPDDTRQLELALIENIQRENLNPMELASAYKKLIEQCHITQNDLGTRVGKSRAAVANTLRLLILPADIQEMVRLGQLTEGHARAILSLPDENAMREMARRIVGGGLSVRTVESEAGKVKKRRLVPKRKLPALNDLESYLKQILGTSVKIVPGLKHGRIEIEYYGDEDLERLLDLMRRIESPQ
ncbi:MAG: ParB/RepB/Spo0J family partition protein [Candidatus Zixiibacteriota bacterium]